MIAKDGVTGKWHSFGKRKLRIDSSVKSFSPSAFEWKLPSKKNSKIEELREAAMFILR